MVQKPVHQILWCGRLRLCSLTLLEPKEAGMTSKDQLAKLQQYRPIPWLGVRLVGLVLGFFHVVSPIWAGHYLHLEGADVFSGFLLVTLSLYLVLSLALAVLCVLKLLQGNIPWFRQSETEVIIWWRRNVIGYNAWWWLDKDGELQVCIKSRSREFEQTKRLLFGDVEVFDMPHHLVHALGGWFPSWRWATWHKMFPQWVLRCWSAAVKAVQTDGWIELLWMAKDLIIEWGATLLCFWRWQWTMHWFLGTTVYQGIGAVDWRFRAQTNRRSGAPVFRGWGATRSSVDLSVENALRLLHPSGLHTLANEDAAEPFTPETPDELFTGLVAEVDRLCAQLRVAENLLSPGGVKEIVQGLLQAVEAPESQVGSTSISFATQPVVTDQFSDPDEVLSRAGMLQCGAFLTVVRDQIVGDAPAVEDVHWNEWSNFCIGCMLSYYGNLRINPPEELQKVFDTKMFLNTITKLGLTTSAS